jgi:hypothetical protein
METPNRAGGFGIFREYERNQPVRGTGRLSRIANEADQSLL